MTEPQWPPQRRDLRGLCLFGGPALALVAWVAVSPAGVGWLGLSAEGAATLAILVWMACWWLTEPVDLAVTALLPALLLPIVGAAKSAEALAPYANDVIFLFGGGCAMAIAIERHGLAQRLTRLVLHATGTRPHRIVLGLLATSVCVSAWVSNTATTAMLLPIGLGLIAAAEPLIDSPLAKRQFAAAALLAIAYGSSIGGVATILGSPPNPIASEWLMANGVQMEFWQWARFGVPTALAMAVAAAVIFRWSFPMRGVGSVELPIPVAAVPEPLSRAGWMTLAVFVLAVSLWCFSPLLKPLIPALSDGRVALAAAFILMVLPSGASDKAPVLPWSETKRLPWGVFVLGGGGLSLAEAMERTGVSAGIAAHLGDVSFVPALVILAAVVLTMVLASEIASNTALTATAVPIIGAIAPSLGIPVEKAVIGTALGASLAFIMPVGTPPNALVYATGRVASRDMIRTGVALDIASMVIVTLICWLLV